MVNETKADYVRDKSFGDDIRKVDERIASTFDKLKVRWEENRVQILDDSLDTGSLRKKWILPFLEALDLQPNFVASNVKSDSGVEYQIPYKGWDSDYAVPIQMVLSSQDFDAKDKTSRTHSNKSPQDALQQFLNTSNHQWAILINGKKVRVLRDFYHSISKGFLEFDLEGIFETGSSDQFRVLYRVLHRSRFENQYQGDRETEYDDDGNEIEQEDNCILENFHKKSRETGVKVGNKLRDQVIEAIEKLGNGFAETLDPDEFQNGKVKAFYAEILNVIYRFLFLMFAEQKGWLPMRNGIYARTYSINALREMTEKGNFAHDNESDLWEGLKVTFKLVGNGHKFENGESINAFGGQLFSDQKIELLNKLPLRNKFLLSAINRLCYFQLDKLNNRINYANLAIDELGSVYESLLDYEPKLAQRAFTLGKRDINRGEFYLDDRGTDRKTTGSYYTDSRLVAQLIDSALVPVIENAIKDLDSAEEKEKALLNLKVADIACGSGAFICAALEKLGEELAIIRMGDEERPTEDQLREAKRDVLLNCIYGVDLNPMALDLAKFALWITAALPDMPLTFLDHKLKCGNALIGATPELVKKGIPEEAYKAVGNDNSDICAELKKKVKKELAALSKVEEPTVQYGIGFKKNESEELLRLRQKLNQHKQVDTDDVANAEAEYHKLEKLERQFKDWMLADVWTSAFFVEKTDHDQNHYPTNATLESLRESQPVDKVLVERVQRAATEYRFFHYHLEFPEVFNNGGFDCLLGNPPWEKIKLQEKEYFAPIQPSIATARSKTVRSQLIAELEVHSPEVYNDFLEAKHKSEIIGNYLRHSESYVHGNRGDINLYALFAELFFVLLNDRGKSGFIAPPGIATDDTYKGFIKHLIHHNILESFFNFTNRGYLFREVESTMSFALFTFSNCKTTASFNVAAKLWQPEHLKLSGRLYELNGDAVVLLNPNTQNLPIFETEIDAQLLKKIYSTSSILQHEGDESLNSWKIIFGSMFHMTSDSGLFKTSEELIQNGCSLSGNRYLNQETEFLPLYESKLIGQYNHRANTFEGIPEERKYVTRAATNPAKKAELANSNWTILPRYWVSKEDVNDKVPDSWKYDWLLGFRNAINAVADQRSTTMSVIPRYGVGNSLPLVFGDITAQQAMLFIGNFNCFVTDYITRQKASGGNLNFYIVKQLAFIGLDQYPKKTSIRIIENVSKLAVSSNELIPLSKDLGLGNQVFNWSSEKRFQLKCQLDAIYAHLYQLEKDELGYLLETFPIVKRKDLTEYGSFRTKDVILQLFDEFDWVRDEMKKPIKG